MNQPSINPEMMAALLDGLLAGAEQPLDSVGAWAERLLDNHSTPLAQDFVNQLGDEWLDADPPDALSDDITRQVIARLSAWHPGWPHLWAHILRVTGVAVALAAEEDVDPRLAYLMGICHDVAKLDELRSSESHEELGADFVGRALRGKLNPSQIESIQAAILKDGDDTLADILHDADKLDKIGAAGVLRRVSTQRDRAWLPSALARVGDDLVDFPAMRFDLSRDLARSKRDFLGWFLPAAESST